MIISRELDKMNTISTRKNEFILQSGSLSIEGFIAPGFLFSLSMFTPLHLHSVTKINILEMNALRRLMILFMDLVKFFLSLLNCSSKLDMQTPYRTLLSSHCFIWFEFCIYCLSKERLTSFSK